jgi:hypothetical protein
MSEWSKLDSRQAAAVRRCIEAARKSDARESEPLGGLEEAYAYPNGGRRIAWGFNGGAMGFNIARGIEAK